MSALNEQPGAGVDARGFLQTVVPWNLGGYVTIHWHRPGERFLGRSCGTIDDALAVVADLRTRTQHNIYFCISHQRLNGGHRDRVNALGLSCVPVDIDIAPDNPKKYPTLAEAIASLLWCCDQLGIPRPSLLVASGGGLHGYWLSDRVLTVDEWQPFADALKAAFKNAGLKFDAGCTGDAARVLRVPGTLNYKYDPPRRVRLLPTKYATGERYDFASVFGKLKSENKASPRPHNKKPASMRPSIKIAEAFKDLPVTPLADGIAISDTPLPFEPIKAECGWLREGHETGGKDHDQPQWHLAILAATFLENGNALAHQLSNQHPDYGRGEKTEEMWDRKVRERAEKNLGWPGCKAIDEAGSTHCKSCPHFKEGKSPLNLVDQVRPNWRREYEERVARRRAEQIKQNTEIGDDVAELAVPLILTPKEMIERLVWIGFSGAVVDRVTFRTRKKEQASSEYAASVYYPKEEEDDAKGGEPKPGKPRAKTRKPKPIPCLNIWMHSPLRTTVDALAWVPGGPQFCRPPENFNNAQTAFNTWRGITPMPMVENWQVLAQPFVDHVGYLVPVESERLRLMQWLAHIIQHPDVLPHTSYLMVTPKTGIGRNWMASVLVRVLRGYVAAGVSLPELLDGGFNGRLSCKLLAIVDELREGPSSRRYERGQRLKSIITEENRLINPKFGIQSIEKNCCRWLKFSNFFDALPFDNTDRRIETIANPTERMTTLYYERIYGLLHDPAFIASVWWLLKTMDIRGFKPGAHASMNEAKERALVEMMTDVERAVHDFKDECVTALASRKDIELAARISDLSHTVNAAHLTHAITHTGMTNTGRRVKDAVGFRHPVVIVDTARWTVGKVKAASVGTLLKAMGKAEKK